MPAGSLEQLPDACAGANGRQDAEELAPRRLPFLKRGRQKKRQIVEFSLSPSGSRKSLEPIGGRSSAAMAQRADPFPELQVGGGQGTKNVIPALRGPGGRVLEHGGLERDPEQEEEVELPRRPGLPSSLHCYSCTVSQGNCSQAAVTILGGEKRQQSCCLYLIPSFFFFFLFYTSHPFPFPSLCSSTHFCLFQFILDSAFPSILYQPFCF